MSNRGIHVLLVEDNSIDARLIGETLSRGLQYEPSATSFEVEWVERLSAAIKRLAAGGIDVILLDLVLPDSQGFDTFDRIAAQAPDTPIVVLSGLDDESLAIQAVRHGAQDYLVKGQATTQLLVRAIRYAIERKRTAEALRDERDKLISILDAMPDGVYIVNQQYEVEYINPALETAFGPLRGRPCYAYFHDRCGPCPWCRNEEVFAGQTLRSERTFPKTQRTYDLIDTPLRDPDGSLSKLQIFRDITEQVQAKEEIQRRNEQLVTLNAISATVSQSLDLDQILNDALDTLLRLRLLGSEACAVIFLRDRFGGDLRPATYRGNPEEFPCFSDPPRRPGCLCGLTVQRGEMLRSSPEQQGCRKGTRQAVNRQELCLPLKVRGNVLGVLAVGLPADQAISDSDIVLLSSISEQIAIAVDNSRLFEAVARGKREWETTFDTITDSISIQNTDLRIQQANRALTKLLKKPFSEVIGYHCYELIHHASEPPEECPLREAMASGRPTQVEWSEPGLNGIFQCSIYPLRNEDGSIRGGVQILRDITASRQAEKELRRRNEELVALNAVAATIGQSPDLSRILPATLDIVLLATGLDGGWIQLLGERHNELSLVACQGVSPDAVERASAVVLEQEWAVQVAQERHPTLIADITTHPYLSTEGQLTEGVRGLSCFPIKSKDRSLGVLSLFSREYRKLTPQEVQMITSVVHQIGVAVENVRLAQEASEIELLRELDRLRSELIANVSHELRTPLGLIKILCTTLLREDIRMEASTQSEFLHDIEDETDKLTDIVDHLLDLSQMEHRHLRLDLQPTDVGQLLRRVAEATQIQLDQHQLICDLPDTPLLATVDAMRVEQVLRNLLANAVKYAPEGGAITILGQATEGELLIQVQDQGIGIPPESLGRIFERFYRVENETTQQVRGAGLGLTVCRGIVEAHGGRIWAESVLGEGSTFAFTLPLEANPSRPPLPPGPPP